MQQINRRSRLTDVAGQSTKLVIASVMRYSQTSCDFPKCPSSGQGGRAHSLSSFQAAGARNVSTRPLKKVKSNARRVRHFLEASIPGQASHRASFNYQVRMKRVSVMRIPVSGPSSSSMPPSPPRPLAPILIPPMTLLKFRIGATHAGLGGNAASLRLGNAFSPLS